MARKPRLVFHQAEEDPDALRPNTKRWNPISRLKRNDKAGESLSQRLKFDIALELKRANFRRFFEHAAIQLFRPQQRTRHEGSSLKGPRQIHVLKRVALPNNFVGAICKTGNLAVFHDEIAIRSHQRVVRQIRVMGC